MQPLDLLDRLDKLRDKLGGVDTLSAALKAGSKTPTGCVVLLHNSDPAPVGLAVVDVLVRM